MSCGHSRRAGMACFNHWIPAFAGMTERAGVRNSAGMAEGLSGWQPTFSFSSSFRRRPESRKAGRGVKGRQGLSDSALGCCGCHSRSAGMACFNHWIPRPSFQTRLYHLHPCRRACAGMTEGEIPGFGGMTERAAAPIFSGMAKGLSGWRETYFDPRRHSGEGSPVSMQACS